MTAHPVPDRHGRSLLEDDPDLLRLLPLYLPADLLDHLRPHLQRLGQRAGGELDALAATADQHPPTLAHRHRTGVDAQRINKHLAYRALEQVAFGELGLAAMSHRAGVLGWPAPMPPAAKYALSYLLVQAEFGLCCPLSMTDALARTLRKFASPALAQQHLARLTSQDLDTLHQGAMFMTEQGAGSDVAATSTRAVPEPSASASASASAPASAPAPVRAPAPATSPEDRASGPGAPTHRLWGDKWFCSNPDADLALVLARIDGAPAGMAGVSLFLLPRTLDDGQANAWRIVRLKDKLGSRSMASGEVRLEGAQAWLVGEPGRGFQQMADMVNHSRLSNGMRAAGLMRRATTEALFIARARQAFGGPLVDKPLMRRQLLKLLLPTEQARSMVFQAAEALRRSDAGEPDTQALVRLLTPLIKFRACRDARRVTGDAMEVRGGCGYIEEWSDARVLRDAHLGSIWEGTSNIVALDVLRAIRRDDALPAWRKHLLALLNATPLHDTAAGYFAAALAKVAGLARRVAAAGAPADAAARQVASALYHCSSAVAMAWEAGQVHSPRRMRLAQLVLRERLLPQDPLDAPLDEPGWLAPLLDAAPAHDSGEVAEVCIW